MTLDFQKNIRSFLTAFSFLLILGPWAQGQPEKELSPITSNDRILVLAPHPDDETIGAGGLIQQAIKAGAKVKVVLLTYGENNEFAFIVYEKRIVFRKKEFLRLGEVRREESLAAMEYLGLDPGDIVSLGFPDFGTMEVLLKYWGSSAKPFKSMLSRVRQVPYATALSLNVPYVGESVLTDLEKVIFDFRPTRVVVSHPADVNRDHRALYLFTRIALWDLEGKIPSPEIDPYIIHVVGWPKPRGYHPELALDVPPDLKESEIGWKKLDLSRVEVQRKKNSIELYQSQIKYAPNYLVTFARKNEDFGDYSPIPLANQLGDQVQWTDASSVIPQTSLKEPAHSDQISSLEYALQKDKLLVRLTLKREIDKELGVMLYLLPYSKATPFSQMPKVTLNYRLDGLIIHDKLKRLPSKEVEFESKNKTLLFKIPLSFLGNPDRILSSAKTSLYDLALDETAWRVLALSFQ
ncbi:MAG: PIG-L family deacetylase [Candidatus Omnitrophica bacterium]|nr:PIG-L family deacetylase [Candidatus Omnitrophota bacterium]